MGLPVISPGNRILVTERIVGNDKTWLTEVEGVVLSIRSEPTGAWFAHLKDDHLWLLRIVLRKDDGEICNLVADQNMEIEVLA